MARQQALPRWEVVLVSAPSASAEAAGTVGAAFVSFAGPRPLLGAIDGACSSTPEIRFDSTIRLAVVLIALALEQQRHQG